ncbi:Hpt domain-containing protein [Gayadomonas joobiniege]|uniref:Hpt domain-containing protein n=1 Tax=Gayadomonas joobiniege TaxID=1234606 RepID=UPI00035F1BA8|nr:Hpt domain-containing protein [Gayadomonas joobiniege]
MVIDREDALRRLGGNEQLLQMLLNKFVQEYSQSPAELEALLAAQEYQAATQLAHSVKGAAANLGMLNLTEQVKEIEGLIKGSKEVPEKTLACYAEEIINIRKEVEQG